MNIEKTKINNIPSMIWGEKCNRVFIAVHGNMSNKEDYVSQTDDLAILSFKYDGDLTVLDFDNKELSVNDRIMVIGHPEGNRFRINYGYIKSDLKNVRGNKVIEHNAYMKQGN